MSEPALPIVVLISGRGSNLQSIIDGADCGSLNIDLRSVISNRADAAGLDRARRAGITAEVVSHSDYPNRDSFDRALSATIDSHRPALVVLAGFMRVLGESLVRRYAGRMINIHPSLLPAYRGLHTHERVLAAGDAVHGASVHYVTPELDGGPVIAQARVAVFEDDDPQQLADRVLVQEHHLLPTVLGWFADRRLSLESDRVVFDGSPQSTPQQLETPPS